MYSPSGDQVGLLMNQRFSREICFGSLPSASIVQMFHRPSRSLRDRDAPAVRAEPGLHVERRAARQPGRRRRTAAVDRHDVDVAEQIEDDPLAVRADVDIHPRALGRVERQLADRAEIGADVPLLLWRLAAAREQERGQESAPR